MTKIIIEKEELEAMKNKIDSLLKKAEDKSFPILALEPIDESHDLDEKEQVVIEYLNKNPGSTKEQVVSGCVKRYSRIPILKAINGLLEKGLIIEGENSDKKRTYALYVNYQDIVISLKEELKFFEFNYCELLDYASQIMAKLQKDRTEDNIDKITNILNALIGPYKYFCIMYIISDVLLWNRRPLDNYTLYRKFVMFFDTMKRIYSILHERFPDVDSEPIAEQLLYDSSYGFYESNIIYMLKTFDKYGLRTWAEPVLDSLWRLSYPILPLIYPSYYKKEFKDGNMKDWKKILENHPELKSKSEGEQLPFDK